MTKRFLQWHKVFNSTPVSIRRIVEGIVITVLGIGALLYICLAALVSPKGGN
jgi:hypothetical protein